MKSNPASVVQGPKHVVKRGKTPILSPEEAREFFASFDIETLVGLRDRALIGVLIYSFARVSAAVAMRVEDYFPQGKKFRVQSERCHTNQVFLCKIHDQTSVCRHCFPSPWIGGEA